MDLRNLCQKLDLDAIRAKLPNLPALPALPRIKLPKLKSRKIFRNSREIVNRNSPQKLNEQQQPPPIGLQQLQPTLPPPPPSSRFIRRTPTRISTISSLMHQESGEESTYRSANSIDDDFAFPSYHGGGVGSGGAVVRASSMEIDNRKDSAKGSDSQLRMTFTERLHRSYKDLSEFRLKHIFAKKTVVRRDSIRVQTYVTHYEEDLIREAQEQERRDSMIAENYTFRFKVSQQHTDHSNSVSPDDSPRSEPIIRRLPGRSVGALSGDESGMETTPPPRKPGIAATRFARVRNPPLRQSSSEHDDDEEMEVYPEPNVSSVWAIQKQQEKLKRQNEMKPPTTDEAQQQQTGTRSKFSYKEGMRRFKSYMSPHEDSDAPGATQGSMKILSKIKTMGKQKDPTDAEAKRKTQGSPPHHSSEDETQAPSTGSPTYKAINAIKTNFKRLQQSMKSRSQPTPQTDESGDEQTASKGSNIASKAEKLKTRLRRFRSRDVSIEDLDADANAEAKATAAESSQSPIRQVIAHKFDNLKKSLKKRSPRISKSDESQQSDGESSPERRKPEARTQKRSDTLIKRLRHMRARKHTDSTKTEPEATNTDEEGERDGDTSRPKSRAKKFNEARQRTFKKVNERMQQMKFFHKSQEQHEPGTTAANEKKYHSEEEDWDESPEHEHDQQQPTPEHMVNHAPTITRSDFPAPPPPPHERDSPEQERLERMAISGSTIDIPSARAAWTTKPFLSHSTESDNDPSELPRVLLHQENSDSHESTLIIAVTRPKACSSPIITEIKPAAAQEQSKSAQQDWVPNKKIISDFMLASSKVAAPITKTNERRKSIDSSSNSDSDSWKPESSSTTKDTSSRRTSQAGLVSIEEKCEAWRVKSPTANDNHQTTLYKTKSIDIFEKSVLKGGALTAFEDFDDELRDEPVMRIATKSRNSESCERESSEDTADDDSSSRVTKISVNRISEIREDRVDADDTNPAVGKTNVEVQSEKALLQYGNSRESLIANFDENDEDEEDDDDSDEDDDDRPPSEAPPSPPPNMSPPPPPLPQRQPSMHFVKKSRDMPPPPPPPPLPKSNPPPVPSNKHVPPPRIPERSSSMVRAPKPLVKTSSLRLAYSEQVKPADVGKVNKLISQFEPIDGSAAQRPRIIPRRIQQDDSEDFSDEDYEDYATMADKFKERYANIKIERDTATPTPTNTPQQSTPERKGATVSPDTSTIRIKRELIVPMVVTTTDEDNNVQILSEPTTALPDPPIDANSNSSRANSEYGSPLEYPSSLRGSLEAIAVFERRDGNGNDGAQRYRSLDRNSVRSRRSMTRDDENFYSFDSDEENSYYSISSTGSNRYIVEL